jgi:hypothetical protein
MPLGDQGVLYSRRGGQRAWQTASNITLTDKSLLPLEEHIVHRMTADDYLLKSASAGRMGKAAEYLIAAACVLSTRGELNVSTSMVDDEGVDLVFHRRDGVSTLAVQVKARMSDSDSVQRGNMVAFIRSQTFRKRPDLDLLFVAIDIARGAVLKAWLIPSGDFADVVRVPDARGRMRFVASMKEGSQDRWASRRLNPDELAPAILARLKELETGLGVVLQGDPARRGQLPCAPTASTFDSPALWQRAHMPRIVIR